MKLLYSCDSIIPSRTANSIHAMKMCQAFAANGHKVVLLAPYVKQLCEPGVNNVFSYYHVEESFILSRKWVPKVYGLPLLFGLIAVPFFLYRAKPDLVYGRSVFGCFASVTMGIPTIFEAHSPLFREHYITRWFLKKMLKSSRFLRMVVISSALKKMYQSVMGDRCPEIVTAHDGADISDTSSECLNWPGRPNALQLGYVGHLYQGRGIEIILAMAKSNPDMDFHLIGGMEKDISHLKNTTQLNNLFIHGFVPPALVGAYRDKCQVLLAPYQENCHVAGGKADTSGYMSPLKIFEYMASKKAIMVSDLPVIHEVLNKKNAVLVKPDDVSVWSREVRKFLDKQYRQKIAAQAFRDFQSMYTWQNRAEKVLKNMIC